MTEFKKGDRVKVEFEGIVAAENTRAGMIFIDSPDKTGYWLHSNYITKLHDPMPTKLFTVIKVGDRAIYQRFSYAWGSTSEPRAISFEEMQELANEHGFTVLYAGDDE